MFQALMLAALLPMQARTVEERIKELSDRIAVLDEKAAELTKENHDLKAKIAQTEGARENVAKATADYWIKRYAVKLALTEKQTTDIRTLWLAWTREGFEKPVGMETWKAREATLRAGLNPEQATLLEKTVRAEFEASEDNALFYYAKQAGVPEERRDAYLKVVRTRYTSPPTGMIPQAHESMSLSLYGLPLAVAESLPELAAVLTSEEHARLTRIIEPLAGRKPKQK